MSTLSLVCTDAVVNCSPALFKKYSKVVHDMMIGIDDDTPTSIPVQVQSRIIGIIIEWMNLHAEIKATNAVTAFDDSTMSHINESMAYTEFLNKYAADTYGLFSAANYLDIGDLIGLIADDIAKHMAEKSDEEIIKMFDIKNAYTEEERRRIITKYNLE